MSDARTVTEEELTSYELTRSAGLRAELNFEIQGLACVCASLLPAGSTLMTLGQPPVGERLPMEKGESHP